MSEPTTAPDPAAITILPEHAIAMLRDSAAQACAVLKAMAHEDRLLLL